MVGDDIVTVTQDQERIPWARVPRDGFQAFEYCAYCNGVPQRVEKIFTFDHFAFMGIIRYWNYIAGLSGVGSGMTWHYVGSAE